MTLTIVYNRFQLGVNWKRLYIETSLASIHICVNHLISLHLPTPYSVLSRNEHPWNFHASTLTYTIIALIRPTNEFWLPPKVKKEGHNQTDQVWIIRFESSWYDWVPESYMFLPQSTQKLPMYPLSCKFLVWYDLWLPLEGQRAILIFFLYHTWFFSHFILNLSKFDLFGTIYDHS